jgi:hypothetical protein
MTLRPPVHLESIAYKRIDGEKCENVRIYPVFDKWRMSWRKSRIPIVEIRPSNSPESVGGLSTHFLAFFCYPDNTPEKIFRGP